MFDCILGVGGVVSPSDLDVQGNGRFAPNLSISLEDAFPYLIYQFYALLKQFNTTPAEKL